MNVLFCPRCGTPVLVARHEAGERWALYMLSCVACRASFSVFAEATSRFPSRGGDPSVRGDRTVRG